MQSSSDTDLRNDTLAAASAVELCEFAEANLYTAVVSDSLDQMGVRGQAMREYLRPIHSRCICAGWARTIAALLSRIVLVIV